MGCGASAARPPSVTARKPGDLRDRSLQDTVELKDGIAQAGKWSPKAPEDTQQASRTKQDVGTASSLATLPSSRPASAAAGTPLLPPDNPPSSRPASAAIPPRPTSAATSSRPASAAPRAAAPSEPPAAQPPPPDPPSRAASAKSSSRPPSASGAPPAPAPAGTDPGFSKDDPDMLAKGVLRPTKASSRTAAPKPALGAAGEAAAPPPGKAPSARASSKGPAAPSRSSPPPPATPPAPTTPQGLTPPQPRMVDCAVSLQFLIEFCKTVPEDMPTWKVVTEVIVPATRDRKCRYVELLRPEQVGRCDYFVSHRWATPFSHLVRYVQKHLMELGDVDGQEGGATGAAEDEVRRSADKVFVWCDIFAINQHPGQVQVDDLAQLKDCVDTSDQTLLCLDDKGLVLTRIWCLYEIWNTILAGGPQKLAVLGYDVNEDAFKEVYITLDVSEAQATVESDRVRILADIEASTGLQELNLVIKKALVESTQAEAEDAQKALLPKAKDWKEFQRVIETINKHIQMLTAVGRHQEAQRYGYVLQGVSAAAQKANAPAEAGSSATEKAAAGKADGAACGTAAVPAVPEWHWTIYPKEPSLRQIVEKAEAAEKGGKLDAAMKLHREAVTKAQEREKAQPVVTPPTAAAAGAKKGAPPSAAAARALDAAGCRLRLATFLLARGYMDQACAEAEPGVKVFEELSGSTSLTFASAAYQLVILAKYNWQIKDLRLKLMDQAYGIQEAQLGRDHAATLDTLKEKAEATYNGGDFPGGVQLFHDLAVRLSDGVDLVAKPASPAAAAKVARTPLSAKAKEVWLMLATYLGLLPGREEDGVHVCRALIPPKRHEHIRLLYDLIPKGGEYSEDAKSQIQQLGLPPSAPPAELPAGVFDPDNARYDMVSHSTELSNWSLALAKQGQLEEAVRLGWRLADVYRSSKHTATLETTLPAVGKMLIATAYERGLMLDMQVPGVSKVAAKMLATERRQSGGGGEAASSASAGGAAGVSSGQSSQPGLAPAYDGPSYMELVTKMSDLWGKLDYPATEVVCREIVRCQGAAYGPGSKEAIDARIQLGRLLQGAGRKEEAISETRAALELHEKILHGKDPTMVYTLSALADMLDDRAEGEKLHRRAVDHMRKIHGPDHSDVGQAMISLGSYIMNDSERLEEGQKILQDGLAIHEKFQQQQQQAAKAF